MATRTGPWSPPSAFTRPDTFTTRPTLQGTFGMSASTHWLATAAAQAVLERGGNAFDAATAGAFVLHVVEPHLNGPGGDMTGVFVTAEEPGTPVVLMGQGPAPAGATVEHYLAEGLELVPGSGALAAAVPAAVDAWLLLLRDHGTWELGDVLEFAIGYARDGHPMLGRVGTTIAAVAELFQTHWPTSAELWMPGGRIPAEGELVRNPAYARTLQRLVDAGTAGRLGSPARAGSTPPAASGARASWPRPWWSRSRPRTGIPPARTTGVSSHWRTSPGSRPATRRPPPWSSAGTPSPRRGRGGRARRCFRRSPFSKGSTTSTSIRPPNSARTPSWKPRSWRSRTGKRTTATRMCRWSISCPPSTAPAAGR